MANIGLVKEVLNQAGDQLFDRHQEATVPAIDAGTFLKEWITEKIPQAVVGLATRVAGREDGSGFIANEALKAGQDPDLMGGIFRQ